MYVITVTTESGLNSIKRADTIELAKDFLTRQVVETCIDEFGVDEFCEEYCYDEEENTVYIYDNYDDLEEQGKIEDFLNFMRSHIELCDNNAVVFLNAAKTSFVQICIDDVYALESLEW